MVFKWTAVQVYKWFLNGLYQQLDHIQNLVSLEARNGNGQGDNAVTIADLIRASLRMNPDRIVVGEIRGAEAIDMLQAMNTGHDGSLSTGHANSAREMLTRIETMVLSGGTGAGLPLSAIRGQIAGALDILIHLGRLRDRSRRVLSIMEILDYEKGEIQTNTIYEYSMREGRLVRKASLTNREKLIAAGDGLLGL